jgi:hypothetical protein
MKSKDSCHRVYIALLMKTLNIQICATVPNCDVKGQFLNFYLFFTVGF